MGIALFTNEDELKAWCNRVADVAAHQNDVTNADYATALHHTEKLAAIVYDQIEQYIADVCEQAVKDAEARDQAAYERKIGL